MFNQILGLILALLLIQFVPLDVEALGLGAPWQAVIWAMAAYALLLVCLAWQGHRFASDRVMACVQVELLAFLGFIFFILGVQRLFADLPLANSAMAFLTLFCYGGGLACYHYGASHSLRYALKNLQLLLPLTLPLLTYVLLSDTLRLWLNPKIDALSEPTLDLWIVGLYAAFILALAILFLMLLPCAMIRLWQCEPLRETPLSLQLENLCKRASFRHGGLKIWWAMQSETNAAIIGTVPAWRYILLTPRLLAALPADSIEAILAHEIGHSKHRHLLLYPLILAGMVVCGAMAAAWLAPILQKGLFLASSYYPSGAWAFVTQPSLYISFAIIIALYFRFVFGYFSRLFERQADLYGITLGLPPGQIAKALDAVAHSSGDIHEEPCWHHYSLSERIRYIALAGSATPRHHSRRVRCALLVYSGILIAILGILF